MHKLLVRLIVLVSCSFFADVQAKDALVSSPDGAVTVTDAVGKTVLRAAVVSDRQQLDIADLPAGTYFVTLTTKEGTSTRKLVVE